MANVQNVSLGPAVANLLKIAAEAEDAAVKAEKAAVTAYQFAAVLKARIPNTIRLAQPFLEAAQQADAKTAADEVLLATAISDHERAKTDALNARKQADDAYFRYIAAQEAVPPLPELISEEKIQKDLNIGIGLGILTFGVSAAVAGANAAAQREENRKKQADYDYELSIYNNNVQKQKEAAESFNVRAQTFEADQHVKFKEMQRLEKVVAQDKATALIAWSTYEARKIDEQRDRESIASAIAAYEAAEARAATLLAAAKVARTAAIDARNSAISAAVAALLYTNNQGITKFVDVAYDTRTATFVNNEPRILLISEYFDTQKNSLGAILVWQKYANATHYEVFKRNIFIEDSKFERILFLDSTSLDEETRHYLNYFSQFININIPSNQFCIIFDPLVKEDRIYEYKIKASFVPNFITDVDFNSLILSKEEFALKPTIAPNGGTVFNVAQSVYREPKLAWIIALLNDRIKFFGPDNRMQVSDLINPETTFLAIKSPEDMMKILKDSFYLFGEKKTLMHVVNILGGLNDDFKASFSLSLNEVKDTFSYDIFVESIRKKIPSLNYILNAFSPNSTLTADEIAKIKKLPIAVPPSRPGAAENYTTLNGLSNILNFVNGILATTLDIQVKDNINAIAAIFNGL